MLQESARPTMIQANLGTACTCIWPLKFPYFLNSMHIYRAMILKKTHVKLVFTAVTKLISDNFNILQIW